MLANVYGYSDENGTIIFNIPEELKRAGMKVENILLHFEEFIGISQLFIKFDCPVQDVCGRVCSPKLELSDTNPYQQLIFFYQRELSQIVFVKEDYVNLFKTEQHLHQLDLFKIYITEGSRSAGKVLECYIQCLYQ